MTWNGVGSHAESSVAAPGRQWFLAEGATGGPFNLFYLLQNTSGRTAAVTVRFLRPPPDAPIVRDYSVPPRSRYTIWLNAIPGLAGGDVSASITSTEDIAVERAMYLDGAGTPFLAGHAASAVTAPALDWFLAEGATGAFFDEYILLANPSSTPALVQVDYLLPDGTVIPRAYELAPESRRTIWVDVEHPWLSDTAVSARLHSLNGVPFVAERSMWWADGGWYEAHNSPGAVDDRDAVAGLGRRGGRTAARLDLRAAREHVGVRRPGARHRAARRAAARWSAPWRSRRTAASTWTSRRCSPTPRIAASGRWSRASAPTRPSSSSSGPSTARRARGRGSSASTRWR